MTDSAKEIKPKLRPDLEWLDQTGDERFVVRDPLACTFFTLSRLEYYAARCMDGGTSLRAIVSKLRRHDPTAQIDLTWLGGLVMRFRSHHLLLSSNPNLDSGRKTASRSSLRQLLSPLAIRIPLFDPSRVLQHCVLPARALFHPAVVILWLIVSLCLSVLVLGEFFSSGINLTVQLRAIRGDTWLMLFACYLVAKSLHEIGHALACVYRKVECSEIGLMFLCFAPCLYCDTTDSWKLKSKWQRASIAAAGMYVELILASMAAAVWLATHAGTIHHIAASMMVICSLGTLLINSNPLLKYDGYYILSDLWGVPNLAEQSRSSVRHALVQFLTAGRGGGVTGSPGKTRHQFMLCTYAMASAAYRVFVVGLILWFLWTILVPRGLGFLAMAIAAPLLIGLVLSQYRAVRQVMSELWQTRGVRIGRLILFLTLLLALGFALFQWPIASRVRARGTTDFESSLPIFANHSGELTYCAANGDVAAGDLLLTLASAPMELERLALKGEVAELEEAVKQLRIRRAIDASVSYELPTRTEQLTELKEQLALKEAEHEGLTVYATQAATFLANSWNGALPDTIPRDDHLRLSYNAGSCQNCFIERGTLVGWLVQNGHVVEAIVPDFEVKKLQIGDTATVQWDAKPGHCVTGKVVRIAPEGVDETPVELDGDPMLDSTRGADGVLRPIAAHYLVSIQVEADVFQPLKGSPATIQIVTSSKTVFRHLRDIVQRNVKPVY